MAENQTKSNGKGRDSQKTFRKSELESMGFEPWNDGDSETLDYMVKYRILKKGLFGIGRKYEIEQVCVRKGKSDTYVPKNSIKR